MQDSVQTKSADSLLKAGEQTSSLCNWLRVRPQGLYCIPGDFYIDPSAPVDRAVITHGHADHARGGHHKVWATDFTLQVMRSRYGEQHAQEQMALAYGEILEFENGLRLSLHPAGHIRGSAQLLMEYQGLRVLNSGDYKRRPDPSCEAFEPVDCDVFITEATFALPVFKHPPIDHEVQKLLHSLELFPERCHLVGVYALGKCQRLIAALRRAGYSKTLYLHGALVELCRLYEQAGMDLGSWQKVGEDIGLPPLSESKVKVNVKGKQAYKHLAGQIVLAPPSALADRWSRKFPNVRCAMASGWMHIRGRAKQRNVELPLVVSDHCDWPELLQTIEELQPKEVWVTHGREDALLHQLRLQGIRARALSMLGFDEDANS